MIAVPQDAEAWRAWVADVRDMLDDQFVKLAAFFETPAGLLRVSVTADEAIVKLPGGEKVLLEDWLGASSVAA